MGSLTNAGRNKISQLITGTTSDYFNAANSYIGVGTSPTAFAVTQTNLLGTKLRKVMDSGFPTISTNIITFQSTFSDNDANFDWNEFGIFNASTGGTMLVRFVEGTGTKVQGQTWILKITVPITIV